MSNKFLENWVAKIRTGDSKQVVDLYHDDGLLLGTFSDKERFGHNLILEYFENLLKSKVDVEIVSEHIHESESLVTNSGLYNFIVDGKTINARFSFVFIKMQNDWKILSHHSSVLPESWRLLITINFWKILIKKDPDYKKPQNSKSFGAFLKKRAPIYLGLIGLFLLFAYPALTEKDLNSILDYSFEGNEKIAVDMVKTYSGPNDSGITILEVIEEKINEKHEGQKIFDDEETWAEFIVEKVNEKVYEVVFVFNAENNQSIRYEWHANIENGEIDPRNTPTKTIQQIVDYSD